MCGFVSVQINVKCFIHLHEIVDGLYFHYILSVCVCLCVCLSISLFTKFQPNGCTDLDAFFAKQLLTALAQSLLKFVTLGKVKVTMISYPFLVHIT